MSAQAEFNAFDSMVPKIDTKQLMEYCRPFRKAQLGSALFQLSTTLAGYAILLAATFYTFAQSNYWLTLPLMVVAAGFLVRIFIIQHDCGHGSFFTSRQANNWTGRVLSILTFTPYDMWRKAHALHHAASGNLDRRCIGSIDTLTVDEYKALSPFKQFIYRAFRHPAVLLLIGSPLHAIVLQRFAPSATVPYMDDYHSLPRRQLWPSVIYTNIALLAVYGPFIYAFGWQMFVFGYLPIVVMTAWMGGWLFYIQHQFEQTYWARQGEWDVLDAALYGSSYYVLPKVLQWFSGNIGLHHLHHFCSNIPNYRLQACVDGSPELTTLNRMTLRDSLRCLHWRLWDDAHKRMVSFAEVKTA